VKRLASLLGGEPDLVVYLKVPLPIAVSRLRGRQVCDECDAAYGPGIPASSFGRCDHCGGALRVRADDAPGALARRLAGWQNRSPEILAHYEGLGILVEVDATPLFTQVRAEVLRVAADLANSGLGPQADPR
jgi:adenylate kinase